MANEPNGARPARTRLELAGGVPDLRQLQQPQMVNLTLPKLGTVVTGPANYLLPFAELLELAHDTRRHVGQLHDLAAGIDRQRGVVRIGAAEHRLDDDPCSRCWEGWPRRCRCGGLIHGAIVENAENVAALVLRCSGCGEMAKEPDQEPASSGETPQT